MSSYFSTTRSDYGLQQLSPLVNSVFLDFRFLLLTGWPHQANLPECPTAIGSADHLDPQTPNPHTSATSTPSDLLSQHSALLASPLQHTITYSQLSLSATRASATPYRPQRRGSRQAGTKMTASMPPAFASRLSNWKKVATCLAYVISQEYLTTFRTLTINRHHQYRKGQGDQVSVHPHSQTLTAHKHSQGANWLPVMENFSTQLACIVSECTLTLSFHTSHHCPYSSTQKKDKDSCRACQESVEWGSLPWSW